MAVAVSLLISRWACRFNPPFSLHYALHRALTCALSTAIFRASMLEIIEKLLILQDRDRRILRVSQELAHIGPERESLRAKAASTQSSLEAAKLRVKQIETDRKQKDLEI